MKLFTKVLANRLRAAISRIVDADQTGFIHGRSISEIFVYAGPFELLLQKKGSYCCSQT
jgi:hypothetical protein